jgi:hypothetical protein
MTISWSEIPGAFPDVLISDGLFVNTRSNMFPSLVGLSCFLCLFLLESSIKK